MAQQKPSLTSLESSLRDCLLKMQDPTTGGWGEHPGGHLSVFNTAEALIALLAAGIAPGETPIQRGVGFLLKERIPMSAPDEGAWPRKVGHGPGSSPRCVPDIIRTAIVVSALVLAGEGLQEPHLRTSIEWLVSRQNNNAGDTGWAYQRGEKSQILPTCYVLLTLMRTSSTAIHNQWKSSVEKGLAYLSDKCQLGNGSFGNGNLTAAHSIYCCLVLQAARECGFSIKPEVEKRALQWLLDNPDDAVAPVEEQISIDPQDQGNYTFTFSMEQLLLRVLSQSTTASHRETELWLKAQRSLYGNFDEITGGLYGQRVFSWSTAAGLHAIKVSESHLGPIRSTQGEDPTGLKIGNAILLFVVLLVLAVVYLTNNGKFEALQAGVFGFLVLACLLAYGKIGEQTFRQLTAGLMRSSQTGREGGISR